MENDRGITLLSVVGKLLNIIMFILRLLQVLEKIMARPIISYFAWPNFPLH